MAIKKHIPNTLTCLNLFSGCVGLVLAFENHLILAAYAIVIAAIFDFFDGMVARLLKAYSDIGKELDSLADMVSFGVLPSVIIFQLFKTNTHINFYLPYAAFLIAVFSALRLAKFNIDTRQTENFIGLPTPANALLIGSLPLILNGNSVMLFEIILNPYILLAFTIIMSLLLVAEIPLLSLKFQNLAFGENRFRYLLIILSIILLVFFNFTAIPIIIFNYILLSIIQNSIQTK
ncbi:MAG: CDP-diacylglycerol--serine O-phosphatidyltransferase [Sphingobacteriaceae bacterium]